MNDSSVQFGTAIDTHGPNVEYPYIYTLVNKNEDPGVANPNFIGPLVPALSSITRAIKLDASFNFRVQRLVLSAIYLNGAIWEWYDKPAGFWLDSLANSQTTIGIPLIDYIQVVITIVSSDGRIIIGGDNGRGILTGNSVNPQDVSTIQGGDYGSKSISLPYLVAANGIVQIQFTNTNATKDIRINAALIGKKVRI